MKIEIIKGSTYNPVAEFFSSSNTPETDAKASVGLENADRECVPVEFARRLERERDEARTTIEDAKRALNATDYEGILLAAMRVKEERDEAREQVKELIYIADRAIALADIDFENDKFGVVSELRSDLAKIKKSK